MMRLVYKLSTALLMLGLLLPATQLEARREYTKTVKKEFDITANGTTSLSNKYGKVQVKTWDRNRVKVAVTIIVNAGSESSAQDVFDRIGIDFSNAADYVRAETNIEPQKKGWNMFWSGGSSKSDYAINYEVFVPETNNLELYHKYGDMYVAEMRGKVDVEVKYVNFKLEGVGDDSRVDFSYGNGTINTARDLNMNVGYGKLSVGEMQDMNINSKYSQITIGEAGDIRSESKYDTYSLGSIREFRNIGKYDNYAIGSAQSVDMEARYSHIKVGKLAESLDLDMEYGGAEAGLGSSFERVSLNGRYTDFRVNVNRSASFRFEATATYAGIKYPREMDITYEKEQSTSHEVKGYAGSKNSDRVISARLNYGGFKLYMD